ncbi:hypothetical protein [Nonomuraea phyllanthi]|uniref:hypothetical protein n=1 Tax=Nonomuraea phyllanthi TaxID=2219224 RepID=UPI001D147515|nr:hypothetical protein [Nonomuraea phyllanthi]
MVIVDAVLETYDADGFTAWPIAQPSNDCLLALSGLLSPAEVGTAMAVIFSYNGIPVTHATNLTGAHLEQHLAEAEGLIAPGGLRFRDNTTGVTIAPGCCFGLENWRDWWDVIGGKNPGSATTPRRTSHIWVMSSNSGSTMGTLLPSRSPAASSPACSLPPDSTSLTSSTSHGNGRRPPPQRWPTGSSQLSTNTC